MLKNKIISIRARNYKNKNTKYDNKNNKIKKKSRIKKPETTSNVTFKIIINKLSELSEILRTKQKYSGFLFNNKLSNE